MVAAAAAAVESAAPRMQKIVGRRLLPSLPLLRPVHRDRATSAKNEGLVGGGQWMWRSLARPLACHRFDQFQSLLLRCLRCSLPLGFFFRLALPSPLLFLLLLLLPFRLARLSLRLFAVSCGAGPLAATGASNRTGSGNVTNNSKLQCIMDTCTHTRSQSSYNL
jgi:hypothetical protein